jgi:hypothetical protein
MLAGLGDYWHLTGRHHMVLERRKGGWVRTSIGVNL